MDPRTLIDALPLTVPIVAMAAAVCLVFPSAGAGRAGRGALLSTGIVGMASIVHDAGGLIDIKGGTLAAGALLGFGGSSLILAAAVVADGRSVLKEDSHRLTGALRLFGPVVILLGAGLFTFAVVTPWTTRPFPLRLVWLPPASQYWIWSTVVPSAIVLPVVVAGVRMVPPQIQRQTELGIAFAGGVFATLLFVQILGRVLLSAEPPGPPVFVLEPEAYLGLASGAVMVAGATFSAFLLRH